MPVINLEPFKYSGANITGFQLIDPARQEVSNVISDWIHGELRHGKVLNLTEKSLQVRYS